MANFDASAPLGIAALISSLSALIWSVRRKPWRGDCAGAAGVNATV